MLIYTGSRILFLFFPCSLLILIYNTHLNHHSLFPNKLARITDHLWAQLRYQCNGSAVWWVPSIPIRCVRQRFYKQKVNSRSQVTVNQHTRRWVKPNIICLASMNKLKITQASAKRIPKSTTQETPLPLSCHKSTQPLDAICGDRCVRLVQSPLMST